MRAGLAPVGARATHPPIARERQQPHFRLTQSLQNRGIRSAFQQGDKRINASATRLPKLLHASFLHWGKRQMNIKQGLGTHQGFNLPRSQLQIQHTAVAQQGAPGRQTQPLRLAIRQMAHPCFSPEVRSQRARCFQHRAQCCSGLLQFPQPPRGKTLHVGHVPPRCFFIAHHFLQAETRDRIPNGIPSLLRNKTSFRDYLHTFEIFQRGFKPFLQIELRLPARRAELVRASSGMLDIPRSLRQMHDL